MVTANVPVGVEPRVVTVMTDVTAEFPGVGLAGEKLHADCAGSPEQDRTTGLPNAPPTELTVTVTLTELPFATDGFVGDALIEKSTPAPERLTAWGEFDALSETLSVPL